MSFRFLVGGTLGPRQVGPLLDAILATCLGPGKAPDRYGMEGHGLWRPGPGWRYDTVPVEERLHVTIPPWVDEARVQMRMDIGAAIQRDMPTPFADVPRRPAWRL